MGGLWVGLAGVAVLLGLDVRGGDLGAVGEMVLVVIGYAVGPMVVSRRLTDVPTLDVVAVSLGLGAWRTRRSASPSFRPHCPPRR